MVFVAVYVSTCAMKTRNGFVCVTVMVRKYIRLTVLSEGFFSPPIEPSSVYVVKKLTILLTIYNSHSCFNPYYPTHLWFQR